MLSDVRYAVRSLMKTPGFTAVAVLTLALGIGMNTAIFSLLNAALLRSLPVRNPEELRVINWTGKFADLTQPLAMGGAAVPADRAGEEKRSAFSLPAYELFREQAQGFSAIFAFQQLGGATLLTRAGASTADGLLVSGNFFQGYGTDLLLGRALAPDDDRMGAPPAVVISYRLWEREFGLDPYALGKILTINGTPCAIVGILRRGFADPLLGDPSGFYVPLSLQASLSKGTLFWSMPQQSFWNLQLMARLAADADERQAKVFVQRLFDQSLLAIGQKKAAGRLKIALDDGRRGPLSTTAILLQIAKPVFVLMSAVGILLLIACANLASLLLARGAARERELAVRAALGASRWRLVWLPLLESVLLSLAGGVLGVLLAAWICGAVSQSFFSQWLTGDASLAASLDLRVMGFTFGVCFLSAFLFGLLPALRASAADPLEGLKGLQSGRGSRLQLGGTLVVVQVGLSVVLLVGTGLMVRTFANLSRASLGFNAENLLLLSLKPGQAGYTDRRQLEFYDAVKRSVSLIPGVSAVSLSLNGPLMGSLDANVGFGVPCEGSFQAGGSLFVGESFLSTMGIPLLKGRDLSESDTQDSPRVAVVNDAFASRCLPGREPLGHAFKFFGDEPYRVVGVGADSRFGDVKRGVQPLVFLPARQQARAMMLGMTLVVRSVLPAASLEPAVRKAVAAVDPRVPINRMSTQQGLIDKSIDQERLLAAFGGFVGTLAALLAGIGLFGLLAYTVSRRTREIGVRMALGARSMDVVRLVVTQGSRLVCAGLIAGIVATVWVTKLLRGFLWGVETTDPWTIAAAAILLMTVAAIACFLPARRAVKVDPLTALRAE